MGDKISSNKTLTSTRQKISEAVTIQQLLKVMVDNGGSDLHLAVGSFPLVRIHGDITRIKVGTLQSDDTQRLIFQILTEEQQAELESKLEIDFSFSIKGLARFRANIFYAKGGASGVFRHIPNDIPDFSSLQLPHVLTSLTELKSGLVLCTGPTGSGKSTTLAALLDQINTKQSGHIVTLEDPIEFIHQHRGCVVNQREVGTDSLSFKKGLKSLLRQDPDYVLIGEMRDLETIEAALTIAETGHLVFGTLHTNSAVQTVSRLINVFPANRQDQVRTLLSFVLKGVIAQQLIQNSFNTGRSLAMEVLIPNMAVSNLIRENKIHQIYSQMQVGQDQTGMMTMNQSLAKLVKSGMISQQAAVEHSNDKEELKKMLGIQR